MPGEPALATWIATAGLLTVGAITPGPNNLIVMREAAGHGWRAAVAAGAGVVSGGLALLLTVTAGAGVLIESSPGAFRALGVAAGLLPAALGASLILQSRSRNPSPATDPTGPRLRSGVALFLFQFINPKAWVLTIAVVSSPTALLEPRLVIPQLAALFVVIPAGCLACWSVLGRQLSGRLQRRRVRVVFDRLTGLALIAFGLLLLMGGLDAG